MDKVFGKSNVLAEYAKHYNRGRPHRALQFRAPADNPDVIPSPAQRIQRHDILDGFIHECRDTTCRSSRHAANTQVSAHPELLEPYRERRRALRRAVWASPSRMASVIS
ncbi:hypothetical protein ACWCQN_16275 [Streptomyces sp. NPDC001984]